MIQNEVMRSYEIGRKIGWVIIALGVGWVVFAIGYVVGAAWECRKIKTTEPEMTEFNSRVEK